MKLKALRVLLSAAAFLCLTLFFLGLGGGFGLLAKLQFLPALLTCSAWAAVAMVSAALFGRIYCSTLCPLGVLQDVLGRLARVFGRRRFKPLPNLVWARTASVLVCAGLLAFGGASLAGLMDPYSTFGRIASQLLLPAADAACNWLADALGTDGAVVVFKRDVFVRGISGLTLACASLAALAVLVARWGRVVCNVVCPTGAMLAMLSKKSLFRIAIDPSRCKACGLCSQACKAGCLDGKAQTIDNSRCVRCFNCLPACPHGAIAFRPALPRPKAAKAEAKAVENVNLRSFVGDTACAAAFGAWALGGFRKLGEGRGASAGTGAVPPPGASVASLRAKCTACGLCVARCPRQVLTPAGFSDYGTLGALMPKMDFARGFCRPDCTECGEACPTGAIPPLSAKAKPDARMGTAEWDRAKCLVCAEGISCGLCARRCPHGAVSLKEEERDDNGKKAKVSVPVVDRDKCRGCGACEHYCPSRAIRVRPL